METEERRSRLGTEPIGALLPKFAVPSIVAMMVSALYNMVDQIFIGNKIGPLGNAATNVAFPLTITCTALALLCGIGGAANFNLSMGRKQLDKAERYVGAAIGMMLGLGLLLCLAVRLFLEPMMVAFGATDKILDYSLTYTGITSLGFPFLIMANGGSNLVRADGSPTFSMVCNLVGALINCVLDPLFIFTFDMGIAGAAWATIIGQIVSAAMVAVYLSRFKTVKLHLKSLIPTAAFCGPIAALGIAPFFNQMAMMVVQIAMNNTLTYYGGQSIYGSEIPLACAGVISKVNMLFMALVIGIAQGLQPIASFNYGAKNYQRVKEAFRKALTAAACIAVCAFACFQLFPRQIISVFGDGSAEYFLFAEKFFRIYLFCTFLNGIQPICSNLFTAIGRAKMGVFVSLTRQIIFLLPLLLLLPMAFGIEGIMFSAPVADGMAAALALVLVAREFRLMARQAV